MKQFCLRCRWSLYRATLSWNMCRRSSTETTTNGRHSTTCHGQELWDTTGQGSPPPPALSWCVRVCVCVRVSGACVVSLTAVFDAHATPPSYLCCATLNGSIQSAHGSAGGFISYASPPGFVHTSYNLIAGKANGFSASNCARNGSGPCTAVLEAHPEWFWPRNDPGVYGQLCWSEPSLIAYLKTAVRDILALDPNANIVSVSQNDNHDYCNTTAEAAIIAEEGSPMGPMLRTINAIADDIAAEYPHVVRMFSLQLLPFLLNLRMLLR